MPTGTFAADATIYPRRFTADAWISVERWRHHRTRDHFGAESDLFVILSEPIGKYEMYTPIHWVISDLAARILALENGDRKRASFVADSWIALSGTYERGVIWANAVFKTSGSSSFKADAVFGHVYSVTADAVIMPSFTADAFIV